MQYIEAIYPKYPIFDYFHICVKGGDFVGDYFVGDYFVGDFNKKIAFTNCFNMVVAIEVDALLHRNCNFLFRLNYQS